MPPEAERLAPRQAFAASACCVCSNSSNVCVCLPALCMQVNLKPQLEDECKAVPKPVHDLPFQALVVATGVSGGSSVWIIRMITSYTFQHFSQESNDGGPGTSIGT